MITVKEMRDAAHTNARIIYSNGKIIETYVEAFIQAEDEDEEPMILFMPKLAAFQSELERIEIIE